MTKGGGVCAASTPCWGRNARGALIESQGSRLGALYYSPLLQVRVADGHVVGADPHPVHESQHQAVEVDEVRLLEQRAQRLCRLAGLAHCALVRRLHVNEHRSVAGNLGLGVVAEDRDGGPVALGDVAHLLHRA